MDFGLKNARQFLVNRTIVYFEVGPTERCVARIERDWFHGRREIGNDRGAGLKIIRSLWENAAKPAGF